jgi:hypothetical protein
MEKFGYEVLTKLLLDLYAAGSGLSYLYLSTILASLGIVTEWLSKFGLLGEYCEGLGLLRTP